MSNVRPLIAGNWKMNGLAGSLDEARLLAKTLDAAPVAARVGLAAPATLIARMAEALNGSTVMIGGQDCHPKASGAFTGDVSAEMLRDAGAAFVILGHSERRAGYGESDALVAAKTEAALRAGLEPVICVGETLEQRQAGEALEIVTAQVRGSLPQSLSGKAFAVAYEPVWAIGTGLTPSIPEIEVVHAAVRAALTDILGDSGAKAPILYGGSVKPDNARDILATPEVNGALVGGASLKADDFLPIVRAAG